MEKTLSSKAISGPVNSRGTASKETFIWPVSNPVWRDVWQTGRLSEGPEGAPTALLVRALACCCETTTPAVIDPATTADPTATPIAVWVAAAAAADATALEPDDATTDEAWEARAADAAPPPPPRRRRITANRPPMAAVFWAACFFISFSAFLHHSDTQTPQNCEPSKPANTFIPIALTGLQVPRHLAFYSTCNTCSIFL